MVEREVIATECRRSTVNGDQRRFQLVSKSRQELPSPGVGFLIFGEGPKRIDAPVVGFDSRQDE